MHESFQIFQPNIFVLILFFADQVFFHYLLIPLIKSDKILGFFFCQLILGNSLNYNTPEGRSVHAPIFSFQ